VPLFSPPGIMAKSSDFCTSFGGTMIRFLALPLICKKLFLDGNGTVWNNLTTYYLMVIIA